MATPLGVHSGKSRRTKRQIFLMAAALSLSVGSALKAQGPYLDWGTPGVAPNTDANSLQFTPAPFLYDGNVTAVQTYLQQQAASGGILAVRINAPISTATAQAIFNNYAVTYVFADLEGLPAIGSNPAQTPTQETATLAAQITASTKSPSAYIGNYSFATLSGDSTLALNRGSTGTSVTDFRNSGATMVNPQLYPGSPDYRNAAAGDTTISGGAFPNLRSSLFILPIERLSNAAANNAPGTPLIPYVSRFMNANNPYLTNGTTNGMPSFTPGAASGTLTAAQTANQMLSRNDFEAQLLHYRLRGASGFHLFTGGVVGYTDQQFQADALTGFQYLDNSPYGFAATSTTPVSFSAKVNIVGSGSQFVEDAGVIASGVSNSNGKMALFVSNLSGSAETVGLPSTLANYSVPSNELLAVGADSHNLFEFSLVSGAWQLDHSLVIFNDGGALSDQNGVGVPEPAAISMMAIGAISLLRRRSRR